MTQPPRLRAYFGPEDHFPRSSAENHSAPRTVAMSLADVAAAVLAAADSADGEKMWVDDWGHEQLQLPADLAEVLHAAIYFREQLT